MMHELRQVKCLQHIRLSHYSNICSIDSLLQSAGELRQKKTVYYFR